MAQALHHSHFAAAGSFRHLLATATRPVRALFSKLYHSMMFARQQQANREIERLVRTRGRFTDSLERDISNILLGDGRNQRR